jgi:HAD superfamily hydrolase (TIGR01459 family)
MMPLQKPSQAKFQIISGLEEIISSHNYFIIDLWGVLHDGSKPYPFALEAIKNLKNAGKKIVLLSNAPRRASKAKIVLDNLGFTEDLYDKIITSGEITFEYVAANYTGKANNKFYYIGPDKDTDLLNGLLLERTENANEAAFAVCTGFNDFGSKFEERQWQLDECLAANLTLLCANPDLKVVNQAGHTQICAGEMGAYYEKKDGDVRYFGKPYKGAYDACKEFFGNPPAEQICCIGDSVHTDIAGANNNNAHSIFISSGIHLKDLDTTAGKAPESEKLQQLFDDFNHNPTYVAAFFKW